MGAVQITPDRSQARRETGEVEKRAVNLAVVEVRAAGLVLGFVGAKMGKGDVPL